MTSGWRRKFEYSIKILTKYEEQRSTEAEQKPPLDIAAQTRQDKLIYQLNVGHERRS